MKKILLASASKRRCEIFSYFSLPFETCEHTFDERSVPYDGNPEKYVQTLSREKALCVSHQYKDKVIVAADTIVVHEGEVLHKAKNKEDAFSILSRLSNSPHTVVSGIAVYYEGFCQTSVDTTTVYMAKLTPEKIEAFLQTELWKDKAAAYAIQGVGSLLVERIEGCYYNVIGLPVIPLSKLLQQVGIDLWAHLL